MPNTTISKQVWNLADNLRDSGVSNVDYLDQITSLLFLKMLDEDAKLPSNLRSSQITLPEGCDWETLKAKNGEELIERYEHILKTLGNQPGMIGEIYHGTTNKIKAPVTLARCIKLIDAQQWSALSEDVKGEVYEGLLEKTVSDAKSGAGQYFTPRPLINAIVRCVRPKGGKGKRIIDPCCGSAGFLIAAKNHIIMEQQGLSAEDLKWLREGEFGGTEIVPGTYRLALMNLILHGIGGLDGASPIKNDDSLRSEPSASDLADYILTNPPFGKKSSRNIEITSINKLTGEETTKNRKESGAYHRSDFIAVTSDKQLNFLQHIMSSLKEYGTAAVVLPDSVFFDANAGKTIRENLLRNFNIHTLLRLPSGIFYKQGVKANVLFFQRLPASSDFKTRELWVYDYRTNIHHTLVQNPLTEAHLEDFVKLYHPEDRSKRIPLYDAETNPEGRWRRFSLDEILARPDLNLNFKWITPETDDDDLSLEDLIADLQAAREKYSEAIDRLTQILDPLLGAED